MRKFIFLIWILHIASSADCILIMPTTLVDLNEDVAIFSDLTVETLSLWLRKKTSGKLLFGFGRNVTGADGFIAFPTTNNSTNFTVCGFNSSIIGTCDENTSSWDYQGSNLNEDGSWELYVTRNVAINNGVVIRDKINWIIVNSFNSDHMDRISMNVTKAVTRPFNISSGMLLTEDTLPVSFSEWGNATNYEHRLFLRTLSMLVIIVATFF